MTQIPTNEFLPVLNGILKSFDHPPTRVEVVAKLAAYFGALPERMDSKLSNTLRQLRRGELPKWTIEYQQDTAEKIVSRMVDGRTGRKMGELPEEGELEW